MKWTKEFLMALLIRAIRTGAQTALSMITIGVTLSDVSWVNVLSVSAVSMIASALTSIATGLPETTIDGAVEIANLDVSEADSIYKVGDTLRLRITESEEVQ